MEFPVNEMPGTPEVRRRSLIGVGKVASPRNSPRAPVEKIFSPDRNAPSPRRPPLGLNSSMNRSALNASNASTLSSISDMSDPEADTSMHLDKENGGPDMRPSPKNKMRPTKETHAEKNSPRSWKRLSSGSRPQSNLSRQAALNSSHLSTEAVPNGVDGMGADLEEVMINFEAQLQALERGAGTGLDMSADMMRDNLNLADNIELQLKLETVTAQKEQLETEVAELRAKLESSAVAEKDAKDASENWQQKLMHSTRMLGEKVTEVSQLEQEVTQVRQEGEARLQRKNQQHHLTNSLYNAFLLRGYVMPREEVVKMREDMETMKRMFFFSTALAVKMDCNTHGRMVNEADVGLLYERCQAERLDIRSWPTWIAAAVEASTLGLE